MAQLAAVAPPPAERPLITLLSAALTPPVGGRMPEGIAYESQASGRVELFDVCDPTIRVEVRPEKANRRVEAEAIYAVASYNCTALGFRDGYRDRALATLDAELPRAVEYELWTGVIAKAAGHTSNPYLAHAGVAVDLTPATGAVPPTAALAFLEQGLADAYSGVGMIHTSRRGFPWLPHTTVTGRLITTKTGNLVVPGVGYPGTGPTGAAPAAGEEWVYATGRVTVRLGAPELPGDDVLSQAFVERNVNSIDVRPRVPFIVDFDGPLLAVRMQAKHE